MNTPPLPSPADRPLYRWEKACVVVLGLLVLAFGFLTLVRSAYLTTRKTDYGVYARAAWAVREGGDLYRTADDNDWHYVYPPPFVMLFLPLADPPAGADRDGYVPYPVGVVVWYVVGLLLLGYALHTFAGVCLPDAVPWSRRWWYARLLPFDLCAAALGFTLARGQANILLVAVLAAAFAAAVRARPIRFGAWLAAAACLKVFPGLLVLFPVIRREWRAAIGYAGATVVLLLVLPSFAWGPVGAIRENVRFLQLVVAPGLFEAGELSAEDQLLAKELHNMTAKDSQSFVATLHYWRYPDVATRPNTPDADTRRWHWLLSGLTILVTVAVGERLRRRQPTPGDWLVLLGGLIAVMLLVVPVSHFHYYAIATPFVAGLVCRSLASDPRRVIPDAPTLIALIGWALATSVPLLDFKFCEAMRTGGVAPVATLGLWAFGIVTLTRRKWVVDEEVRRATVTSTRVGRSRPSRQRAFATGLRFAGARGRHASSDPT
jgi:alpha-1,2-mannosyltransferase